MYMIIYLVTNLINQMKYVGQTIRTLKQRKSSHLSSSKKGSTYYLHRAIRKYGAENFKWEVMYNASSEEELNEKETFFIKEYNTNSQDGYNLTEGGRGIRGWKHSELTKEEAGTPILEVNLIRLPVGILLTLTDFLTVVFTLGRRVHLIPFLPATVSSTASTVKSLPGITNEVAKTYRLGHQFMKYLRELEIIEAASG